jgi:GPI mannosyltransferase 3
MLKNQQKDYLYAYLTSIFVFVVTAVFSIGYHQADEHYQIIEFALFKLGINQPENLVIEYSQQLLPGFQPFIAFLFLKSFSWLGISGPFLQMGIIRIFIGLFCLFATFIGLKAFLPAVEENRLRQPLIFLSPLLWFIPFISVRFSSETLSGVLFFLAVSLVSLRRNPFSRNIIYRVPWWFSGMLMGFAFNSRYLVVLMIAGFILWLLIIGKEKFKNVLYLFFGIIAGIGIGVLADYWLYGQWCSPFYNSFIHFVQNWSTHPDSKPWWFWLVQVFFDGGMIVGVCLLFCVLYFWGRYLKNPVTWVTLPFVLVHILIPDKEMRFLYPVAFFVPFMIIYTLQDIFRWVRKFLPKSFRNTIYFVLALLFLLSNTIYITLYTFKAADQNTAAINFIDKHYNSKDIILLYANSSNPFYPNDTSNIVNRFYLPKGLEMYSVKKADEIPAYYSRKDKLLLLCVRKGQIKDGFTVDNGLFTQVFESLPDLYFKITDSYWEKPEDVLEIYQYKMCRLRY